LGVYTDDHVLVIAGQRPKIEQNSLVSKVVNTQ
jgi:hypothetical protein